MVDGLGTFWTSLSAQRKAAVIMATVLAFGAILALGRMSDGRNMTLLYGGLDSAAAGDVLQALEGAAVPYEVRGGAIYVAAEQRDTLRMTLASQGLPANGGQGYELLDSLSGFSTTSQMFDAAYWRAREGELARTIVASPLVTAARVHISAPSARGFQRDRKPTAAVTITSGGGVLSPSQAKAFRFLVASSVPGLQPEDVAVIDGQGNLVAFADSNGAMQGQDQSDEIRDRVQRLLDARVGVGNAVVEVSLETVTESEQIIERRIDPDSRIAISTEVTESTNTSQNAGGGDVTVASNLPDGDAGAGGDSSSSQGSDSREVTNYEVSETQREVIRAPGAIRRLSVAALVNHATTTTDAGDVVQTERPAEELEALRALISSAVGFDEARGDVITIQSLPFEPVSNLGTEVTEAELPGVPLDMMGLIRLGTMAGVALILGLFVVRPILMSGSRPVVASAEPIALPGLDPDPSLALPAAPAMDTDFPMMGDLPEFGGMDGGFDDDPVDRLRSLTEERPDETLQILQSWIEDAPQREEA